MIGMKTEVRNLFRIETKGIVNFENFNQVYYVFEQMVRYDIDVPELEGLSERLTYAFNKIATEKLDRNDVITFFPIIWTKFEPYVKKLLFIINPSGYSSIREERGSVVDVLAKLGISVFVEKGKRTSETEAIFLAYSLRNTEAHECEFWSLAECYEKLAMVMAAYLIVTNNTLIEIRTAMEVVPAERSIKIPMLSDFTSIKVDIFDFRYNHPIFYSINDFFTQYHHINGYEYNKDGWTIHYSDETEDHKSEEHYKYQKKRGTVFKCLIDSTTYFKKTEDQIRKFGCRVYSYDNDRRLIQVSCSEKENEKDEFQIQEMYKIEYQTDGGIMITRFRKKRRHHYFNDSTEKESNNEMEILNIKHFDNKGRLYKLTEKGGEVNYIYAENGSLTRIEDYDGNIQEFKILGNNIFRIIKNKNDEDGVIAEKRLYQEGKLVKILRYSIGKKENDKTNSPVISSKVFIKY